MNGKWILSVEDGEMVSWVMLFVPRGAIKYLKYSPLCLSGPMFVDIGRGILQTPTQQYSEKGYL